MMLSHSRLPTFLLAFAVFQRRAKVVDQVKTSGNAYPAKDRIALCRCGASTTKPFCDGTHSRIGFQAAEKAVPGSAEG